MTTRAQLKAGYKREDDKYLWFPNAARTPGTYFGLAAQARKALEGTVAGYIEIKCFNDVEAELIADQLTPEERARIHFTYLFRIPKEESE